MSNWRNIELGKAINFNPSEKLAIGKIAKKIAMEKLTPFEKKIKGFEYSIYSAGPKFRNGDVLLAKITPCLENGKTAQVDILDEDEVAFGSSEFIVLRNNENTINDYIFYLAKSPAFRKKAIGCMEGTSGRKRVNEGALKLQVVPIPNIDTQKKIAIALSTLDSKIELNNCINAELEAMAKTLYDYWFVQFDFPNEKGKPYKTSRGKMVWNEELKRNVPEGWEVGTLLDIADYFNGLPCQKFRPTNDSFLRVIKIREMHDGFKEDSELVTVDIPQKAIIENGDVLFSWSASLEVMIWTGGRGALNQHIFKVTSKKYPKSFYYFQLINYLQHFKMMAENRKTTMGHITQEHLKQSRIVLPPKELTLKLEKIIAPILSKKINNHIENQQLSEIRDWLLPMLLNGQVKVSNFEKEAKIKVAEHDDKHLPATKLNIPESKKAFAKQVLAGKIITAFLDDPNFTHIKFQKLQYLAEHIVQADLNWNYYRQAAGPYDPVFMHTLNKKLKTSKWFDERQFRFYPLGNTHQIEKYFQGYFEPVQDSISQLFNYFKTAKEEQVEIVATLYAVWNNYLINKEVFTDEDIITTFFKWSSRKANYTSDQVGKCLKWMKEKNVVPVGWGKLIKEKK